MVLSLRHQRDDPPTPGNRSNGTTTSGLFLMNGAQHKELTQLAESNDGEWCLLTHQSM
ncbi:hypothetical protein BS47DRAFT_1349144 [Hydnum rufescens UP504]|uniref:Uncharacterized protein n=1 Tax=Hydnum rufescens UP504 TaxID=1448309 RepID=A0A9P6APY0_9AGAM|nr:hypothetical protein BS47DRAFT_1349144 [Hydnum rufescens UP504]